MKKSVLVSLHLLFWVILLSTFYILGNVSYQLDTSTERFINLGYWPILLAFFYTGYLGIMKLKAKFRFYITALITTICLYLLTYFLSTLSESLSEFKFIFWFISVPEFHPILWLTLGCLFGFFVDWYNKQKDIKALERENLTSNLAMLKFQINPHFLFNTLNNIDTLIFENQNKASQSLVKLSDMMRYMLHDTKPEFVELHQEINHLEDYMSLERLRLKNEKFLKFSIEGDYQNLKIAPMLLIPFVENAFKHAVDSTIESGISIAVEVNNGSLIFTCENEFDPTDISKDETHGIGLDTVKKRLKLLYPNHHDLTITSNDTIYKVSLKLNLNEH